MKLSREVKTGIVAVIVFAVAIWGFNFLKGKNIFNPTNEYFVVYDDIEGVIESGYVYYKGYKIGNITGLEFNKGDQKSFIVQFIVDKDVKIPVNSIVTAIQSNPIASTKDLKITFSDETRYCKSGDTLKPGYDKGLMGMLDPLKSGLEKTIQSLNETLDAITNTFDPQTQKNIKKSIESLNKSLASLGYMVSPHGSLTKTMNNLESMTSNLKSKNEKIGESIDHFANISAALDSANLQSTIVSLDSTLLETKEIMAKINNGDGTAGLLVNDSLLYMNLASATASLDSLLTDLKAHPKRYVHLSVFGKKDK
jgi:phospholipid/cholesterol/gamma-HCH transport system substrate-binding protein